MQNFKTLAYLLLGYFCYFKMEKEEIMLIKRLQNNLNTMNNFLFLMPESLPV